MVDGHWLERYKLETRAIPMRYVCSVLYACYVSVRYKLPEKNTMNHIFHFYTSQQFYEYNARRVLTIVVFRFKFRTSKNWKVVEIDDNEELLLNFYYIDGEVNYEKSVLAIITNSILQSQFLNEKESGNGTNWSDRKPAISLNRRLLKYPSLRVVIVAESVRTF